MTADDKEKFPPLSLNEGQEGAKNQDADVFDEDITGDYADLDIYSEEFPDFERDELSASPAESGGNFSSAYRVQKKGGLQKLLLPGLVIVAAGGVAGYIFMNAGSKGSSQPTSVPVTAADMGADAVPQPQPIVNEIIDAPAPPALPQDLGEGTPADASAPVAEDLAAANTDLFMPENAEQAADTTAPADAAAPPADVLTDGDTPVVADVQPAAETVAAPEPSPATPAEVAAPAEPEALPFAAAAAQAPVQNEKVVEANDAAAPPLPAAVAPPVEEPAPVAPEAVNDMAPPAESITPLPAASSTGQAAQAAPDTYYDAGMSVPEGTLAATVGARKLNPEIEPASRYIIVEKTQSAGGSEALLVSANRALKLGRYEAAIEMFDQLYATNKRDERILMGRAVAYQKAGRDETALMTYEELLAINPNNADALVNMLGLLRSQYPEVALRRLKELQGKYPENAGIAAQIGITEADRGNHADAVRYLQIAASLEPKNAQHLFNMAVIQDRAGSREDAIRFYEQALETDTVYAGGRSLPRKNIYDRLSVLRGQ